MRAGLINRLIGISEMLAISTGMLDAQRIATSDIPLESRLALVREDLGVALAMLQQTIRMYEIEAKK